MPDETALPMWVEAAFAAVAGLFGAGTAAGVMSAKVRQVEDDLKALRGIVETHKTLLDTERDKQQQFRESILGRLGAMPTRDEFNTRIETLQNVILTAVGGHARLHNGHD